MIRSALVLALLFAAGCHRAAAAPPVQSGSVGAVYASLDAKCGETVPELERLIEHGAERLRQQRGVPVEANVFAVVLDNALPAEPKRGTCAPKVDTLVYTIMQESSAPRPGR
jgi:hypothetical protein